MKLKDMLYALWQSLTEVQKPMTLSRPLSGDRQSRWTYTAPADGILYLAFLSNQRVYINVLWNGQELPDLAIVQPASTLPSATGYPVFVKKGDVVNVNALSDKCYLTSRTAFVAYKFQG